MSTIHVKEYRYARAYGASRWKAMRIVLRNIWRRIVER